MGRAFLVVALTAVAAEALVAVIVITSSPFGGAASDAGGFQDRLYASQRPIARHSRDEQDPLHAGSTGMSAFGRTHQPEEIRSMRRSEITPEEKDELAQAQGKHREATAPPSRGPRGAAFAIARRPHGRVHRVSMSNFKFTPETLDVRVGDTIEWDNTDFVLHTATADDKAFDTGDVKASEAKRFVAEEKGRFSYACRYHANMKGTVIVH
jgi:plastocyanin